jgi:hypothetical protein
VAADSTVGGYNVTINVSGIAAGNHTIYLYAVNDLGFVSNPVDFAVEVLPGPRTPGIPEQKIEVGIVVAIAGTAAAIVIIVIVVLIICCRKKGASGFDKMMAQELTAEVNFDDSD